ncbi:Kelch repeat and BTB domain-containing protein 13 [Merluccius polli]|uniref:Kelch repeat and BTB domain-containing protein 13 n=1 Tax=Merluccius polli TaxID=89951 RepID=A0AA47N8K7_MERPO|nr:Kelch repeat and BTB domain-containing protein 13 [Merluccius polli]
MSLQLPMKVRAGGETDAGSCLRPGAESAEPRRSEPASPPASPPGRERLAVEVEGRVFAVDKALLTRHCEYFRALYRSGMRESLQTELRLRGLGAAGFVAMLGVLNGERPALGAAELVEAIECAAFLQVRALTGHLVDLIDSENCLLMCHTAFAYGVRELSHRAALFIRDMRSDLRDDLRSLPAELVDYIDSLAPRAYMAVCSHAPSAAAEETPQDLQRTVCHLDEETGDWKVLTRLPPGASTAMAGVAVLDDKLYIVGGVRDVSKKVLDSGFCYSPVSNSWSAVPSPRQPRYNLTLIGHQGCLYAVGGECERRAVSSVERFRASQGSWSSASQLPCAAASVASAEAMSRIFVCLWKAGGATDIQEYVPAEDRWVLVTTLVRPQSYGLCMVAHRDNLYVMRNGPSDDFLLCVMDRYNLTSGQWSAVAGQYGNSKGSLLTAAVRGDSVFTLNRAVTTEFAIEASRWRTKRDMKGFGRIGSIHTFLLRIPKDAAPLGGSSMAESQSRPYGIRLEEPGPSDPCLEDR